jgi:hypothetical protein
MQEDQKFAMQNTKIRGRPFSKGLIPWNKGKKYSNRPDGYFSRKYRVCVKCGETDSPHIAKGLCKRCYSKTPEQHLAQFKQREKTRMQALCAYGGKYPKCTCCGESEIKFLVIDHIDGCGLKRRKIEGSGSPLYIFLHARHYPAGYQVLCHNCNAAKEAYGKCPHKTNDRN